MHDHRYPNESTAYREARNELLQAEIELRRQTERVAAQRRALPDGGRVPEDYRFRSVGTTESEDADVRLSSLFGEHDSLIVYSFMYGPGMKVPCPSCSSILDGLDGTAPHVSQRAALAVVAKSEPPRLRAWARQRGWRNLRLLSSAGNDYNRDYGAETAQGNQLPALNVFRRRPDGIHHCVGAEMLYAPADEGQENRHVDSIWPVWNLLDLTPNGRGTDWHPSLLDEPGA